MKPKKVISHKNLPSKLPVFQTIVLWLFLDRLNAPSWLMGAIGAVWLILFVAAIYLVNHQQEVDIANVIDVADEKNKATEKNMKL